MTSAIEVRQEACRLCGSSVEKQFSLRLLGKYDVSFLRCVACESLQTETPFWLSETYGGLLPNLDHGAARRALKSCSTVMLVTRILSIARSSTVLDFGGADGLVCRLLRDLGFEAFVYDKYCKNTYADGFTRSYSEHHEIVCAIEVWEHLVQPAEEIGLIFAKAPRLVVVSTAPYSGQASDWAYLGQSGGGHVFFYSRRAMGVIASRYGYDLVARASTVIFSKSKIRTWQRAAISVALTPVGLLVGRLWLQMIRPRRDHPERTNRSLSCQTNGR